MNTSRLKGASGPRRQVEADLDETVRGLFGRLRALQGFSVQESVAVPAAREAGQLKGDLSLADITTFPLGAADECFGEIAIALVDLMDERPEARALLRGRTFARSVN